MQHSDETAVGGANHEGVGHILGEALREIRCAATVKQWLETKSQNE